MKSYSILFFLLLSSLLYSQEKAVEVLSFEEYLAFVKKFHPVAKQADLVLNSAEAELLAARGGFDPKIEVDYGRKEFKGTEYYDILNSTFKVPTWYGLELKANFEQNTGVYLNPERTVPPDGLFSAGVSLDVGQGMFINERMAALRSAKIFREQARADQELLVNEVLYQATIAYFDWLEVYNEVAIYEEFLENAIIRYQGIQQNAFLGEIAAIDTVEAKIVVQSRTLELEQARINFLKERLELSNFLWLDNDIPVELQPNVIPDVDILNKIDLVLDLPVFLASDLDLENHPKLRSLQQKLNILEINRRLKANKLLPDVNLQYNFIAPEMEELQNFNTSNYKAGLSFNFPLFLRKERGELKIAKFKIQDLELDLQLNQRVLENKLRATIQEIESYKLQTELAEEIAVNYRTMLAAEERRMSFGESSLFILNSREIKLIEARLKQNDLLIKYLYAKAQLFLNTGIIPTVE